MKRWQIFSYTELDDAADGTAALHRSELDGDEDLVNAVIEEMEERGYQIVDVLAVEPESRNRRRR